MCIRDSRWAIHSLAYTATPISGRTVDGKRAPKAMALRQKKPAVKIVVRSASEFSTSVKRARTNEPRAVVTDKHAKTDRVWSAAGQVQWQGFHQSSDGHAQQKRYKMRQATNRRLSLAKMISSSL